MISCFITLLTTSPLSERNYIFFINWVSSFVRLSLGVDDIPPQFVCHYIYTWICDYLRWKNHNLSTEIKWIQTTILLFYIFYILLLYHAHENRNIILSLYHVLHELFNFVVEPLSCQTLANTCSKSFWVVL